MKLDVELEIDIGKAIQKISAEQALELISKIDYFQNNILFTEEVFDLFSKRFVDCLEVGDRLNPQKREEFTTLIIKARNILKI